MKKRFFLFSIVLFALSVHAEVHISVDDSLTWSVQQLAPYIGQTVVFDGPIVVCSNRSGLKMSPWRIFEPLCLGKLGTPEYSNAQRINSSCGFMLTGVSDYHRCGEKVYNLKAKVNSTSSLSFVSGTWQGNKRADLEANLPDLGDYRLLVCAFNLENYFMTWGSMGASSYTQHQKQRAKTSKALKKINADIFGLVELQLGNEAIEEIVNDLNQNLPQRNYQYFKDSHSETMQKVDFVYDANTVRPIGTPAATDAELKYRKKMICFEEIATGEKFIYSINHFKAMNNGGESRRVNEAKAVVNLYNSYRQNGKVRDNDVLFMGDFNCYAFTDPVFVFTDNGMQNLHRVFHHDASYSYMYNGLASYIDHALCNNSLLPQITGMAVYHINSDENDNYTYDGIWSDNTMFRCSDHDPVLVGLKLDSTLSGNPYFNGDTYTQDSLTFYYPYAPGEEDINPLVYFDIHTINGYRICSPTKVEFYGMNELTRRKYYTIDDSNPYLPDEVKQFLPLPSGVYVLRFYYDGKVQPYKLIVR